MVRGSRRAPGKFDDLVDVLKAGAKRLSASDYQVDGELLKLFDKHPRLLRRRMSTTTRDGGGVRMARTLDGVLVVMGIERGDVIQRVAGKVVADRAGLLARFAEAGKMPSFNITVHRAGGTVPIHFTVVDKLLDLPVVEKAVEEWEGPARVPGVSKRRSGTPTLDIEQWVSTDAAGITHVKTEGLRKMLTSPQSIVGRARAIPHLRDGKTVAIKFYVIRRGSPLYQLGFRNGDAVVIDPKVSTTPHNVIANFLKKLMATPVGNVLELDITRRGRPEKLRFKRNP